MVDLRGLSPDSQKEDIGWLLEMSTATLHPELESCVVETNFGPWVKHPLVNEPTTLPGVLNKKYAAMTQYVADTPIPACLRYYERPWRLQMLAEWWEQGLCSAHSVRKALRWAWPDTEGDDSIYDPLVQRVVAMFKAVGYVSDDLTMQPPLPAEHLVVYRGGEKDGIAWSTSYQTAQWFADRWDAGLAIQEARAPRAAILGRFQSRNEYEVVVDPFLLTHVRQVRNQKLRTFHVLVEDDTETACEWIRLVVYTSGRGLARDLFEQYVGDNLDGWNLKKVEMVEGDLDDGAEYLRDLVNPISEGIYYRGDDDA